MKLISRKLVKFLKGGKSFLKKIKKCELGSPDGIYVEFPDYQVDTDIPAPGVWKTAGGKTSSDGDIKLPLGHGMVIAVDEKTGKTRGSEYGRYGSQNGHRGLARRVRVNDFRPADPGNPTKEELDAYAKSLVENYPNSYGRAKITYVKGPKYDEMVKKMESAEKGDGYYTNTDYRLLDHNCGTYGCDLMKSATPWYLLWKFPSYSSGTPGLVNNSIVGKTGEYKRK